MYQVGAVAGDQVWTRGEAGEPAGDVVGDDPKASTIAFDFHRFASLKHLVEYPINVLAEFGRGQNHAATLSYV